MFKEEVDYKKYMNSALYPTHFAHSQLKYQK